MGTNKHGETWVRTRRAGTSTAVEGQVLLQCRRRCAICFGLSRDTTIKRGQISHLDRDASNSARNNLVFLCLECHDEYDGRTSQSKALGPVEVRQFRDELHDAIASAWQIPVSFAGAEPPTQTIAGHYVRPGKDEEAELDVSVLADGRVRVEGFALWGTSSSTTPHIGSLGFVAPMDNDSVIFVEEASMGQYRLELAFAPDKLVAKESGIGNFGMNVSFDGQYQRAGAS